MKQRTFLGLLLLSIGLGSWNTPARAQTIPVSTGYVYPVETTGRHVWIIGQRPVNKQGKLVGQGNINQQLLQVFANVKTALNSLQLTSADIRQITYHVRQLDNQKALLLRTIQTQYLPTRTGLIVEEKNVGQLTETDAMVEVEVVAVRP